MLLRHVFTQASVEPNPHCEPLSPPLMPHAVPHGPLRQLPSALSSSLPFVCAAAQVFAWHLPSIGQSAHPLVPTPGQ